MLSPKTESKRKTREKKVWMYGSSGRAPAYQVQDPEFKYQYCKKQQKSELCYF
jgi:hypothetical protein